MSALRPTRLKGEAEHLAGNPYQSKPALPGEPADLLGLMARPRSWYGKKSPPAIDAMPAGRYAYDDGHRNVST